MRRQAPVRGSGVVEIDLNVIRHGRPIDQWFGVDDATAATDQIRPMSTLTSRRRDGSIALPGAATTANAAAIGAASMPTSPLSSSVASVATQGSTRPLGSLRIKLILTVCGEGGRGGNETGAAWERARARPPKDRHRLTSELRARTEGRATSRAGTD